MKNNILSGTIRELTLKELWEVCGGTILNIKLPINDNGESIISGMFGKGKLPPGWVCIPEDPIYNPRVRPQ